MFSLHEDNLSGYIHPITVDKEIVTIKNSSYPTNSIPVSGAGRFHQPGSKAYYLGSGILTAKKEKYGDPDAIIKEPFELYTIPAGEYIVFDMVDYLKDNSEQYSEYFNDKGDKGWGNCQKLRIILDKKYGCSGCIFPSRVQPSGINMAIWINESGDLGEAFFRVAK